MVEAMSTPQWDKLSEIGDRVAAKMRDKATLMVEKLSACACIYPDRHRSTCTYTNVSITTLRRR